MQEQQSLQNLERQMAVLQEEIQARKRELQKQREAEGEVSPMPHDKDIAHEVIGKKLEAAQKALPRSPENPFASAEEESRDVGAGLRPQKLHQEQPSYESPELVDPLRPFQELVVRQNLDTAMSAIAATRNPALIDAFHDWLVEQAYQFLVKKGDLDIVV
ncbi:MAG: hypothetical protein KGI50_04800 [Patescibacteria group bacterium]|nr:hypothetical protein [Patescibacteria group bacterium]MDE2438643.1 hypothetical protein [Patescibacteria group bacterium]